MHSISRVGFTTVVEIDIAVNTINMKIKFLPLKRIEMPLALAYWIYKPLQ